MAKVEGAIEVRPVCQFCGHERMLATKTYSDLRIVARRCARCNRVSKYRVLLASEVRVYEGEPERKQGAA